MKDLTNELRLAEFYVKSLSLQTSNYSSAYNQQTIQNTDNFVLSSEIRKEMEANLLELVKRFKTEK